MDHLIAKGQCSFLECFQSKMYSKYIRCIVRLSIHHPTDFRKVFTKIWEDILEMIEMHNLSKFNLSKVNLFFLVNIQAFLKIWMKVWLALWRYLESQANGIFHFFFLVRNIHYHAKNLYGFFTGEALVKLSFDSLLTVLCDDHLACLFLLFHI